MQIVLEHLRAIDLEKVGYLVLKQGQWNGRQVVSSDWLARSTTPVTRQAWRLGGVSVDFVVRELIPVLRR